MREQQSYFRMVVYAHLMDKLDTQIQEDTPIFGTDTEVTCMKLLEEEFLLRYPLLSRRVDFFGTKQTKGQLFSNWAAKLKSLGEEADLYQMTTEDLHIMRYLTGVVDEKLRTEFLKEAKPTPKLLDKIVHQYEIAAFSMKDITQARRRGGSGGSVEPPLKFYSSERTPFETNEPTPLKQTNPPQKKSSVKKVLKILFSKKKSSVRKKILFSKKNQPPLENLSYAPVTSQDLEVRQVS